MTDSVSLDVTKNSVLPIGIISSLIERNRKEIGATILVHVLVVTPDHMLRCDEIKDAFYEDSACAE